jgi:mono/diheme cytochrome c family protein
MPRLAALLLGTFSLVGPHVAAAPTPARPIVPGFERFHSEGKTDAAAGRLLLTELQCVRCHQPASASPLARQAPNLDGVAGRVRVSYLKKFLADPHATKPGTTMPDVLGNGPDKAEKVSALVHFLASTGALRHERPVPKLIASGRDLYARVGCVACHGTRNADGSEAKTLPSSVPLSNLPAKYSIASLAVFLESPQHARPSGRMPKLLNAKEAKAVANYLLQGIKVDLAASRGSARYAYYEGQWGKVPDFSKLKPKASGISSGFDLGVAQRANDFAVKFDAVLKIDREAIYTFTLMSDDGSKLYIDDKLVVDNDGAHAPTTKQNRIRLTRGAHKVTIGFFQVGGGAELDVRIEAPGFGTHNLGDLVASSEAAFVKRPRPKLPDEDAIEIQPALVQQGKALFASLGCASCHSMPAGKGTIASTLKSPPLARLAGEGGCLADRPNKGAPWYGLSAGQRKALRAGIKGKAPARTHATLLAETLTAFNCYACHERGKVGGPEEALNKFFLTTQPEMGDEGRVPPPLDGVGAKLNLDYLKKVLDQGAHDRPYMHTRMPGFGLANVGHLVEALPALDKLPSAPAVSFKLTPPRVKAVGRHLVGGQAFGCIKCHTFAGHKAEGVQGIDMLMMPKRLRRDWFHAYVTDPQAIRPGTRMPSGFLDGKSVLPELLDGKAPTQVEAMWLYLQDGGKAQLPIGLGKHSIPLVPLKSAILYRNFISGAGTRAIGVGYPERANLAFDANDMRLALIWQGAFIDAARHWTDRGAGFEGPLGDSVVALHGGAPFAVLRKADEAWPATAPKAQGYRFRGYRLTPDDRPTFQYSFGDVQVRDFPNAVVSGKEVVLRRRFTLTSASAVANLHFRAGVGNKIEALANGWYQIDGTWQVKVIEPRRQPLTVRKAGGKMELLVPVGFADHKAAFVLEYRW